jgi:hypothetical protein
VQRRVLKNVLLQGNCLVAVDEPFTTPMLRARSSYRNAVSAAMIGRLKRVTTSQ